MTPDPKPTISEGLLPGFIEGIDTLQPMSYNNDFCWNKVCVAICGSFKTQKVDRAT